jgi:hypothetical protein
MPLAKREAKEHLNLYGSANILEKTKVKLSV